MSAEDMEKRVEKIDGLIRVLRSCPSRVPFGQSLRRQQAHSHGPARLGRLLYVTYR